MRIFRGDGSMQSRNTQSIKRSFVRWVYFALIRRGLNGNTFLMFIFHTCLGRSTCGYIVAAVHMLLYDSCHMLLYDSCHVLL